MYKSITLIIIFVLLCSSVYADIYIIKVRPKVNGVLQPNVNFNYTFNFTSNHNCSGVLISQSINLTMDAYGENFTIIDLSSLNNSPAYLCEYRNDVLRKVHNVTTGVFDKLYVLNNAEFNKNITASWSNAKVNFSYVQNLLFGNYLNFMNNILFVNGTEINNTIIQRINESSLNGSKFYNINWSNIVNYPLNITNDKDTWNNSIDFNGVWVNKSGDIITGNLTVQGFLQSDKNVSSDWLLGKLNFSFIQNFAFGNYLNFANNILLVNSTEINLTIRNIIIQRQYNLTSNYSNNSGNADTVDYFHVNNLLKTNQSDTFSGALLTINHNISIANSKFLVSSYGFVTNYTNSTHNWSVTTNEAIVGINSNTQPNKILGIVCTNKTACVDVTASGYTGLSRSSTLSFLNNNAGNFTGWSQGNIGIIGTNSVGAGGAVYVGGVSEVNSGWYQNFGHIYRVIPHPGITDFFVEEGIFGYYVDAEALDSNTTVYGGDIYIASNSRSYADLYGLRIISSNNGKGTDYGLYLSTNNYSIYNFAGKIFSYGDIEVQFANINQIEGNLNSTLNILEQCSWEGNASFGAICSNDKIMAGYNISNQQMYCCEI